jgi:glycerol-3-phosphate acyltransferase PlsY
MPSIALALIASYLCGAVPFGVLVGLLRGIDVRDVGSGNIGTTNVWRALGPVAGSLVFALDVLKGLAGPFIGRTLVGPHAHSVIAGCAIVAVLGHTFSVFLKFKGGKGIATSLGAMSGLAPIPALFCFALWGVMLLVSRIISVASIVACIAVPIAAHAWHAPRSYVAVIGAMGLVGFLKHIPNMKRIAAGTEPRLGQKKSTAEMPIAGDANKNPPQEPVMEQ